MTFVTFVTHMEWQENGAPKAQQLQLAQEEAATVDPEAQHIVDKQKQTKKKKGSGQAQQSTTPAAPPLDLATALGKFLETAMSGVIDRLEKIESRDKSTSGVGMGQGVLEAFQTAEALAASRHGAARQKSKEALDLVTGKLQSERTQVKRGEGLKQRVEEGVEAIIASNVVALAITAQAITASAIILPEMVKSSSNPQATIASAIILPSTTAQANIAQANTLPEMVDLDYTAPSAMDTSDIIVDMNLLNIKENNSWRRMTTGEMMHYHMVKEFKK